MAKVKVKKKTVKESPFRNEWDKTNWLIIIGGFILLIIGYYLMTFEPFDNPISLSVSPIVLLIAYLVVFPAAILFRKKHKEN